MKWVFIWLLLITLFSFWGTLLGQEQYFFLGDHLAGTKLLSATEVEGLRSQMIEGICRYFDQELKFSHKSREIHWHRNYSSSAEYLKSITPNRARFRKIIGVVDERKPVIELTLMETTVQKALVCIFLPNPDSDSC